MQEIREFLEYENTDGAKRRTINWATLVARPASGLKNSQLLNFVFRDAGVQLTLASPKGGQPPIDPKSDLPENQTPAMARFKQDQTAQKPLSQTVKLADMKAEDYDTVFYLCGRTRPHVGSRRKPSFHCFTRVLLQFRQAGGFGLPFAWCGSSSHYKGAPIVKGKRVTGFTNDEEEEMHLANVVPFPVEDELKRLGGIFEKVPNWQPFSIEDAHLITGQNPASSTSAAQALMKLLEERAAHASA
jgi:putative intracellular protease/amidase